MIRKIKAWIDNTPMEKLERIFDRMMLVNLFVQLTALVFYVIHFIRLACGRH